MNISFDVLQLMTFAPVPISLRVMCQDAWQNGSLYRALNIPFDFLCQSINISFELLQLMTFAPLLISRRAKSQVE